jgi:hypothetical protein
MVAERLAAAWVYDDEQHRQDNARGENYWDLYMGELCAQMGISAEVIGAGQATESARLHRYSCLMLGAIDAARMPVAAEALLRWVEQGGTLIGFNSRGLDDLFGIAAAGPDVAPSGPFAQTAYVVPRSCHACTGIRPFFHPDQPLLAFGPARRIAAAGAELAADLAAADRSAIGAAVTVRRIGAGQAIYCAFALPQTLWVLHQGRPVDRDYDGDGLFRTGDSFVIGDNDIETPYADQLVWLLENMIFAQQPLPSIYTLPPADGRPAQALFYLVGDDEAVPGAQLKASTFLRSLELPYHLNIMRLNGAFAFSPQEGEEFRANGHDFSLHYNFVPSSGFRCATEFTAADVQEQADAFLEWFGERPYANVNHWLRWVGWAEPARWMAALGGAGDGSFVHARMPPLNPCNMFGFPFGTSFPFRFYDDWEHANAPIAFVEKPITGYEMGYSAEASDFTELRRLVDITYAQHLQTSLFYHSTTIVDYATCRAAIQEFVRLVQQRGLPVKHMSLTTLVRWWLARLASSIGDVTVGDRGLTMSVSVKTPEGLVVRVPLGHRGLGAVRCDGAEVTADIWHERGQAWLMVAVGEGEHRLEVGWAG